MNENTWERISDTRLRWKCQKNFYSSGYAHVSKEYKDFFGATDIRRDSKKDCIFKYEDIESSGFVELQTINRKGDKRPIEERADNFRLCVKNEELLEKLAENRKEYIIFSHISDNVYKIEMDVNDEESVPDENVSIVGREGGKKLYYCTKYERDPKLRREAIDIHGYNCIVCEFNFEEKYGEYGKRYIEVHHIKPLSSLVEEVDVDPKTDLVCVCSNCHRMIHHHRNSILTVEELKEKLMR